MAKTIGRNTNVTDIATLGSGVALNASTSTTVVAANSGRINFTISNNSSKDIWLKFQAASVDNDKKGIFLFKRTIYEMPTDNVYTGEISAIADTGTPTVFTTEL